MAIDTGPTAFIQRCLERLEQQLRTQLELRSGASGGSSRGAHEQGLRELLKQASCLLAVAD